MRSAFLQSDQCVDGVGHKEESDEPTRFRLASTSSFEIRGIQNFHNYKAHPYVSKKLHFTQKRSKAREVEFLGAYVLI